MHLEENIFLSDVNDLLSREMEEKRQEKERREREAQEAETRRLEEEK